MPLIQEPGIQRDSTQYASQAALDGRWCRWQYGRPRKMGGYKAITPNLSGLSRALLSQTQSGYSYVHSAHSGGLEATQIDVTGNASVPANRTPAGFTANPNYIWQLDSYYDTVSATQQVLAFAVPGLLDIGYGATTGLLYAGPIYAATPLVAVTAGIAADATGGVAVAPPYTILYGSNGLVQWSVPGKPLVFVDSVGQAGAARVTAQKIVRGLPLRGGGGFSPSLLLWSLDSLIRMYFVGQSAGTFAFDTLTSQSSILSHNGVIEADGIFYWIGQDRFLLFNGVVRELPNSRNLNWFFDNVNRAYGQKAYAMKNARYGEIWFCAPLFGATEPNYAAVYNYRENTWYDTQLPNSGRSFGIENDIAAGTIMSGIDLYQGSTYRLWQHEVGIDEADVTNTNAIRSYYTTGILSAESFQQGLDKTLHIDSVLPDFLQRGNMTIRVAIRGNARSKFTVGPPVPFSAVPAVTNDQPVSLKVSGRQITLTFESNVSGGDFQAGRHMAYIETDQGRRTQ